MKRVRDGEHEENHVTSPINTRKSAPNLLLKRVTDETPIPPSIRVFSNESTLLMKWPKYWSFSFQMEQNPLEK